MNSYWPTASRPTGMSNHQMFLFRLIAAKWLLFTPSTAAPSSWLRRAIAAFLSTFMPLLHLENSDPCRCYRPCVRRAADSSATGPRSPGRIIGCDYPPFAPDLPSYFVGVQFCGPLVLLAPELLQALVATTAVAVVGVTHRVLAVVVLMVVLGRVEGGGRQNFRHYGLGKAPRGLQVGLGGFGQALFLGVAVENRTAVLRAAIAELAVGGQGVDGRPEGFQQFGVAGLSRVETHLHRLEMPTGTRRDLLIAGVDHCAAYIAGGGRQHAGHLVEIGL